MNVNADAGRMSKDLYLSYNLFCCQKKRVYFVSLLNNGLVSNFPSSSEKAEPMPVSTEPNEERESEVDSLLHFISQSRLSSSSNDCIVLVLSKVMSSSLVSKTFEFVNSDLIVWTCFFGDPGRNL
ncbi:hypothetical protein BpHYR1_023069 [Brachionus plicatilis]|uniref:Uncharacterized protein n=1 Tax=Brachionus plicatilis TaxID=10195 RepID=A0A3M7PJ63_BRAPC|nr:hypothetical protein BpHYR1_023069 [Brachionus plicatilis]